MLGLTEIIAVNNKAARKAHRAEHETSRHCSYTGSMTRGVVLHSAKHRSTVFLAKGHEANDFLVRRFAYGTLAAVDKLIESYFEGGAL